MPHVKVIKSILKKHDTVYTQKRNKKQKNNYYKFKTKTLDLTGIGRHNVKRKNYLEKLKSRFV